MDKKYRHTTYKTGFGCIVTPEDREIDVMHYLKTGRLLGGRSLDGVEVEFIKIPDYNTVEEIE